MEIRANFNSRPCERGFCLTELIMMLTQISIHAPARGASDMTYGRYVYVPISIHAPARGASYSMDVQVCNLQFQFTPLREGLREFEALRDACKNFNSRPCERGFSKNQQFLYRFLLFFYSINAFSQN